MATQTRIALEGVGLPCSPVTRIQVPGEWNIETAKSYAMQLFPNAIITGAELETTVTPESPDS